MSIWDLRREFPSLVTDRTAEVAYELRQWLTEEPPVSSFEDNWLAAAFAAAPGPALSGKFPRRRAF